DGDPRAASLEEGGGLRLSFGARKATSIDEKPLHRLQEQVGLAHREGSNQLGARLRLEEGHGGSAIRIEAGRNQPFAGQRIESELRRGDAARLSELFAAGQRRGAVDERGEVPGNGAERRSDDRGGGMQGQELLRRVRRRGAAATRAARRGEEEQRAAVRTYRKSSHGRSRRMSALKHSRKAAPFGATTATVPGANASCAGTSDSCSWTTSRRPRARRPREATDRRKAARQPPPRRRQPDQGSAPSGRRLCVTCRHSPVPPHAPRGCPPSSA